MSILNKIKAFLEYHGFGVCQYLGEKMSIRSSKVRLYFIYCTFITMGSPLFIYLILAFWVNVRTYIKRGLSELTE